MKLEYGLLIAASRGESIDQFKPRAHKSWCKQPQSGHKDLDQEQLDYRFIARIGEALINIDRNPRLYLNEMIKLKIKIPLSLDAHSVSFNNAMTKLKQAHSVATEAFKSFLHAVIPKNTHGAQGTN